jgi:hypothetical protein
MAISTHANGSSAVPRSFYRIVRNDPPTQDDFTSNAAKGRPLRDTDPETRRLWDGISVQATEAQSRRRVRQYPLLGRYIARIELPADAPVRAERTTRIPGHYTLWGDPAALLRYVVAVMPA